MVYNKIKIRTTSEAEEAVCAYLSVLGIDSVEIEGFDTSGTIDELWGDAVELAPDMEYDGVETSLSFYLGEGEDISGITEQIKSKLDEISEYMDIGAGEIEVVRIDESEYRDNWKQYFSAFEIGDIYIRPSWDEGDIPTKDIVINIDPGSSFGTGKHESTYMVIESMQDVITGGESILDIGCGSGILSVAALKLGAKSAIGIDIDSDCIPSSYENCDKNDIARDLVDFRAGDILGDESFKDAIASESYDIIFANILADTIIAMANTIYELSHEGTTLIASGIIDFKQESVENALKEAGFSITGIKEMGEWRSISAKR